MADTPMLDLFFKQNVNITCMPFHVGARFIYFKYISKNKDGKCGYRTNKTGGGRGTRGKQTAQGILPNAPSCVPVCPVVLSVYLHVCLPVTTVNPVRAEMVFHPHRCPQSWRCWHATDICWLVMTTPFLELLEPESRKSTPMPPLPHRPHPSILRSTPEIYLRSRRLSLQKLLYLPALTGHPALILVPSDPSSTL